MLVVRTYYKQNVKIVSVHVKSMTQLKNFVYCGAVVVLLLLADNLYGQKKAPKDYKYYNSKAIKQESIRLPDIVSSVTNTSIALRWLDSSKGVADVYIISYRNYDKWYEWYDVNYTNDTENCEIWKEFICAQISGLVPNRIYTLYISTVDGEYIGVAKATTKNLRPSKPRNLTSRWNQDTNDLVIQWNHPDIPNGNITMFNILKSGEYIADFPLDEQQFQYEYEISYDELKVGPSCDDLEISVVARNKVGLSEATLVIPMPKPKFRTTSYVKDKTSRTFKIQLPEFTNIDKGFSSWYIIVSDTEKSHKYEMIYSEEDEMIFQIAHVNKSLVSWIAKNYTYSQTTVTIDEFLVPETKYELRFLLKHQLNKMICYSVTTLEETTLPDQKYAMLVFVLIPFIITGLLIFCTVEMYTGSLICMETVNYFLSFKWKRGISSDSTMHFSNLVVREHDILYDEPEVNQYSDISDGYVNPDLLAPVMQNSRNLQPQMEHLYMEVLSECTSKEEHYDKLQNHLRTPASPKINPAYIKVLPEDHANEHSRSLKSSTKGVNSIHEPIKVTEFEQYVKYCLENEEFEKQYRQGVPKVQYNLRGGPNSLQLANMKANYVDGYRASKTYIATVDPDSNTVDYFWKMIWQENVHYIIMITDASQANEDEMKKYWFDIDKPKHYSDIIVNSLENTSFPYHKSTLLNLRYKGDTRQVQHLHFTAWPYGTLPFYPQALALFLKQIGTIPYGKQPIVIQSSKGFGRIATFIMCDICLRVAAATGKIDVYSCLRKLREQRINVDNVDQYKFTHLVLLNCLVESSYEIRCTMEMMKTVEDVILSPNMLSRQMKHIDDSYWQDAAVQSMCVKILDPEGKDMPDGYTEIILKSPASYDQLSTYIDVAQVERFWATSKFIVTKYPQQCTLAEFWRLIDNCETGFMLCLNELHLDNKAYCKFYPSLKESMCPVPYLKIHCIEVQKQNQYDMYTMRIVNRMKNKSERSINILHINQWKCAELHPKSPEILVMAYEEMNRLAGKTNPIFVTCIDGIRGGGLFTSLCYLIDKIKTEQICDVCLAVRTVRRNQREFVKDMAQFSFLYKCALHYVKKSAM